MNLSHLSRCADRTRGAKARALRLGATPNGSRLWEAREDDICRTHYPDTGAIQQALPHRTIRGIEYRCIRLGISRKRHWWTAAEISRLRRLYPTATWEELHAAFPGVSKKAITKAAERWNLYRDRPPLKTTGRPELDEIRGRSFEMGISIKELSLASGAHSGYFKSNPRRLFNARAVYRALAILGGTLSISWED